MLRLELVSSEQQTGGRTDALTRAEVILVAGLNKETTLAILDGGRSTMVRVPTELELAPPDRTILELMTTGMGPLNGDDRMMSELGWEGTSAGPQTSF